MCPRTNFWDLWSPNESLQKFNVPEFIHPFHFAHMEVLSSHAYDDRDVSFKGHSVSGTINFGDQGSHKIRTRTHRFGTSHHPAIPTTRTKSLAFFIYSDSMLVIQSSSQGCSARIHNFFTRPLIYIVLPAYKVCSLHTNVHARLYLFIWCFVLHF